MPHIEVLGSHPHAAGATRMIEVAGRRLALTSSGEGAPSVVLETGLGAESSEWAPVQRAVERFARVCRYDRAGRGVSDLAPGPRTADDMVDDLHELLRVASIAPPYVLVGHSFGGLLVRRYAYRHPEHAAGLVLVDSMHEAQFDVLAPHFPAPTADEPPRLREMRAFWTAGWRHPGSTGEAIDFIASGRQAREVDSLGDLPIEILTAHTFLRSPFGSTEKRIELQQMWDGLQQRLASLSTRAARTIVGDSGHFVQRERPAAVVAAIERVLTVVSTGVAHA